MKRTFSLHHQAKEAYKGNLEAIGLFRDRFNLSISLVFDINVNPMVRLSEYRCDDLVDKPQLLGTGSLNKGLNSPRGISPAFKMFEVK